MSRKSFKEAVSENLTDFYQEMNGKFLQADIHSALMFIDYVEDLEKEQKSAIKYVLQQSMTLYYICNKDEGEFKSMISFLNPGTKS